MSFKERLRRWFRRLIPQKGQISVQQKLEKQDGQNEPASTPTPPVKASIASSAPTDLTESLWDQAYDELKNSNAALVEAYEKILSRKLNGQGFATPVTAADGNIIAQDNPQKRRGQMLQLIQAGLDKTAGEAKIKQAIGSVLSAKDIISDAIQAVPQAALAWTGLCVALEVVQNPIAATEANRRGIEIVLKNVDWYSELSSVVLEKNDNERGLSGIRQELKIQVVKLYVLLLSYQIRSVCSYYRDRVLELLRDIASLDDWKADIKAIEEAELGVRHKIKTYAELKTASDLDKLVNHASTKEDKQCIQDLRITDPLDDKRRIEQTKGGLSRELYCWILENPEYQQWRDSDENRLLWIKGDPGKGKTMLLCGIIDELNQQPSRSGLVSYFFCQATDQNLNNATAVLRGLIFMLVRQQPSLVSHVRRRYDQAGGKLFEGANTWFALSDIFTTMLQDPALKGAYLVVDALDECVSDQQQLLDLIILASGTEARVKWIMSSRNEFRIEERLKHAEQKVELSLEVELNAQSIATAVKLYIEDKLQKLSDAKGYNEVTQERVRNYLLKNANNTFLWVALVCQNLEKHALLEACDMLEAFPKGLESLYGRITQQVLKKDGRYANLCKQILMVMMSVYRPITLRELGSMAEINQEFSDDVGYLTDAVALCGSFLTIREDTIYFVHQSAKDYLSKNEGAIFESRLKDIHQTMVSLSLQAMTKILRKNIYALPWTGLLSDDGIDMPSPDPLSAIRYSCVHWVDHLCKGSTVEAYLEDKGPVDVFLREHLLHWLEALGLLHQVSAGILSIVALKDLVAAKLPGGELSKFLRCTSVCPLQSKAYRDRPASSVFICARLQSYAKPRAENFPSRDTIVDSK